MKRFVWLLILMATVVHAQSPQSQGAPIFSANAKYVNGIAPGYAPAPGVGLLMLLGAGTANPFGTIVHYTGGSLTLTASSTNYVFLDSTSSYAPASNTTGFPSTSVPIAIVVTGTSGITSIDDVRLSSQIFTPTQSQIVALFTGCSGATPVLSYLGTCVAAGGVTSFTQVTAVWTSCTAGYLHFDGTCSTPSGTVPTIPPTQALLGTFGGLSTTGNPTAANVTPDALQQQSAAPVSQTTPIAAVTDANAKTALSAHETEIQSIYTLLANAGVYFPSSMSAFPATSGAEFLLFNPTGATTGATGSSCPTSTSNQLSNGTTDTWTIAPGTGQVNYVPCGKGAHQGGWIEQGAVGTGPATVPSGAALSSIVTTLNSGNLAPSVGVPEISSTSQIQGGGSLTNASYPTWGSAGTTTLKMGTTAGGASLCWWGYPKLGWTTSGAIANPAYVSLISKPGDWEIGPGFGGMFVSGAFQAITFPQSSTSNSIFVSGGTFNIVPETLFQMCMVYNPSAGSFGNATVYMNDGAGLRTQVITFTAVPASSTTTPRLSSTQAKHEALLYWPGVQLTASQIAGMYYGFTSNQNANPFSVASNRGPSFTNAPGVQWNTYPLVQANMQDCGLWSPLTNGGNGGSSFYNGTFSHCHLQAVTSAPVFRVSVTVGAAPSPAITDMSIRVDGALTQYSTTQTGAFTWNVEVIPGTAGTSHTYDVNFGAEISGTSTFTSGTIYTGLIGIEPLSVSVPNPYVVSFLPQIGTVTGFVGDSILGTGFNANNAPSRGTFIPLERYNGSGVTNFNTARIASLSVGSALASSDFNPTGLTTSITTPDASGTAFWNNYGNVITNNTPSLMTVMVQSRMTNDFAHLKTAFSTSSNCLAIFRHAEQNAFLSAAAFNSSVQMYAFSAVNDGNIQESPNDGCAGDSYTSVNALNNWTWNGSAWVSTAVSAGTVFTGAQQLSTYRLIAQDVCITVNAAGAHCTYVELGPGAPSLTGGYAIPTMLATANQCFGTVQTCYNTDQLHLTRYGHFVFTRFINAESWATPITVGQFR